MPKEIFGRDFQFLERRELLTFEEIARLALWGAQTQPAGFTHPTGLSVEHAQTYAARACDYGFRVGRGAFARARGQIVQNDSPPSTQRGLR